MDDGFPILSVLIFLPLAGALLLALIPGDPAADGNESRTPRHRLFAAVPGNQQDRAKWFALFISSATLVISLVLFIDFDNGVPGFQHTDTFTWIDADDVGFTVRYAFGLDGLSMPLVLLTSFLTTVAVLISWRIDLRPKEYFAWLLVLESSVLGVFTSLDLIVFFLFWELELIPMFLLISTWGHGARRNYSAMKFVLYTVFGSAFMLVGFLVLGAEAGSFDMRDIRDADLAGAVLPLQAVFAFILIAFAVKLPVVPLHTWLPDAHTDAPTAVSVLLAGVLLKMGGYGILRLLFTLMPDVAAQADLALAIIAAVSIVYGAIITMRQTDLKRLVAYSSVSHMGFVLLGVSALGVTGLSGAALQLVTHGLITGLLFVAVGFIYDRTHTREIADMRGMVHHMPLLGAITVFAGFASLGLPALAGFVAEITIFLAAFAEHEAPTAVALLGVLLAAGYILFALQRTMFGPKDPRWSHVSDIGAWWEVVPIGALVASIVLLGVYPSIVMDLFETAVTPIADGLAVARATAEAGVDAVSNATAGGGR